MNFIEVDAIRHKDQRYDTVGDWEFTPDGSKLTVRVSNTGTATYNVCVAVHEIIEAVLCKVRGIKDEVVTEWDKAHEDHPDPGSIPGCPYYREHMFAMMVERAFAAELDIDWMDYEAVLENM